MAYLEITLTIEEQDLAEVAGIYQKYREPASELSTTGLAGNLALLLQENPEIRLFEVA